MNYNSPGKDYYRILGVPFRASREQIKSAYRNIAKTAHPDMGGSDEVMKLVNEAYRILSDDRLRRAYDAWYQTKYTKRSDDFYRENSCYTHPDLGELLFKSCQDFYNLMCLRNSGVSKVFVERYEIYSDNTVKFYLADKLKSCDNLFLEIDGYNFDFAYSHASDIYDSGKGVLIRTVTGSAFNILNRPCKHIIYVKSDMKFLAKRLMDRYSRKYNMYFSPTSRLAPPDAGLFLSSPSDEQLNAINTIFTAGVSYIWGAPGTGKTKYVLANSIVHYVKNNMQVIVTAPTNNAVEQVLEGVISVLKAEGCFSSDTLLRLGTPTSEFYNKYPECCEFKKASQHLHDIEIRLKLLEEVKRFRKQEKTARFYSEIAQSAHAVYENSLKINTLKINIKTLDARIKECNNSISRLNSEYKWNTSFFASFLRIFSNKKRKSLQEIKENISAAENERLNLTEDREKAAKRCEELNVSNNNLWKSAIKNIGTYLPKIVIPKNLTNWDKLSEDIENAIRFDTTDMINFFNLHTEFKDLTDEQFDAMVQKCYDEKQEIINKGTASRLKHAKIISCTIDTLISRVYPATSQTKNSPACEITLSPAHIFLDEAAYCCLAKLPPLFEFDCPVTLLGDHKQLPPVCEISEKDLFQNEYSPAVLWSVSAIYICDLVQSDSLGFDSLAQKFKDNCLDNPAIKTACLTKSYRFGSSCASVLNEFVYKNGLASMSSEDTGIFFVHAPGEDRERVSRREASAIDNIISSLSDNSNTAILTPYNKQVSLLKPIGRKKHIPVLNVHKAQGREWDTVIFSVVDSKSTKKWFCSTHIPKSPGLQLINTAVSRAKKNIIIVCDYDYWIEQSNEFITALLEVAKPYNHAAAQELPAAPIPDIAY